MNLIKVAVIVAIAIILLVVVVSAYISARATQRDAQRVSDITQLQRALKIYYEEYGLYPKDSNNIAVGANNAFSKLIAEWPKAPEGGSCTGSNAPYRYEQLDGGISYILKFCLEDSFRNLPKGIRILDPSGVR